MSGEQLGRRDNLPEESIVDRVDTLNVEGETKERGKNIKVHAIFVRHGEKEKSETTTHTGLTDKGREVSRTFGEELSQKSAIKQYSSGIERTRETAHIITHSSPTEKKLSHKAREELAPPVTNEEGSFAQQLITIKDPGQKIDFFLRHGKERPDEETPSPEEVAALMAGRVDTYSRMAKRLDSNSDIDLVNATHDLNIAAFLKEVMVRDVEVEGQKVQVTGFNTIEEVGGAIGFNEGFEVLISLDQEGQETMTIEFRGQLYNIDQARMKELVKVAKEIKKKRVK